MSALDDLIKIGRMSDYASTWFDKDIKKIMVDELADKAAAELEQLRAALAAKEAELEGEKKITAQWAEKSGELAAQIMKARKVIQAYSDYHEGEYEEMPEQRAGRRWLAVHPADTKEG